MNGKVVSVVLTSVLFSLVAFAASGQTVTHRLDYRFQTPAATGMVVKASYQAEEGVLRRTDIPAAAAPQTVGSLSVGDTLSLVLFDGVDITLTLTERTPSRGGRNSYLAEMTGYEGVKNAVVVQTADGLQVDIRDYQNGKVYSVFSSDKGVVIKELKPTKRERGSGRSLEAPRRTNGVSRVDAPQVKATERQTADISQPAYVDVMVVYDTRASSWAVSNGGGVQNFAEVQVQKMNSALANTGISSSFRFRLVDVYEVGGDAGGSLDGALQAAQSGNVRLNNVLWDGVKTRRDAVEADVVCILVDNGSDTGTTGLGYSLHSDSVGFSEYAYNACLIRAVEQSHTMTHEVGHNMGAGHSDAMAPSLSPGPQYHSYSSGYYFYVGSTGYNTIMSYNFDGYGNYYTEVPYFSSPDYAYRGVAVGNATHNNSLTLKQTFLETSKYRGGVSAAGIGTAIGCSAYEWETSGIYPWSVSTDASTEGSSCARSCEMSYDTTSWLRTRVVGPATLTCDYMLRTYGGRFAVSCDSDVLFERQSEAISSMSWTALSLNIPSGTHTVMFSYTHPSTGYTSGWGNGVRLDKVAFVGGQPAEEGLPDGGPYTEVSGGLEWKFLIEGGEAVVAGEGWWDPAVDQDTEGEVVVPSRLGGCAVTTIGYSAFESCTNITAIVIPEGVREINSMAFGFCDSLETVSIPSSVDSICTENNGAFFCCDSLVGIYVPPAISQRNTRCVALADKDFLVIDR